MVYMAGWAHGKVGGWGWRLERVRVGGEVGRGGWEGGWKGWRPPRPQLRDQLDDKHDQSLLNGNTNYGSITSR